MNKRAFKISSLLIFVGAFSIASFIWLLLYTFFFITHFPIIAMPGRSLFDLIILPLYLMGYLVPVAVVTYACYFGSNRSWKTTRVYLPIAATIYIIEIVVFIFLR